MTKQESFKKRIRARMADTGERYSQAREELIAAARKTGPGRTWAAEPEVGDEAVATATGRSWNEWCDLIDASPARVDGHAEIAVWLGAEHGLDGWWAQTVTVGYERITGLRLPNQKADGTFTANKSKTVSIDAAELRAMLVSDGDRADLFPGLTTELRSRPDTKAIRIAIGPGVAAFDLIPKPDGRVVVTVSHDRLPAFDDVEEWKFYWADWLTAIDAT